MVDKASHTMVLKVDLQCHRCFKKVKKVLCKFPQIQDQEYDEKQNTVTIKVICCSPEKIKKKIICKSGEAVKSIEIKVPKNPKPDPSPDNNEDKNEKTKQTDKKPEPTTTKPIPPEQDTQTIIKPPPDTGDRPRTCCTECYEGRTGGPCFHGHGGDNCYQPRTCCGECYGGRAGGPCFHGHGGDNCYQPRTCCGECYGGRAGGPCFHGYGGTPWPCHQPGYGYKPVCDEFYYVHCQENSRPCTIM